MKDEEVKEYCENIRVKSNKNSKMGKKQTKSKEKKDN